MTTAVRQRRSPLDLFPDKPALRLYGRIVEVLRHQHPCQLAEHDVNRFLISLAVKEHVATFTQCQALSAILFLYEHILEQPRPHRRRWATRLPVVLTVDEAKSTDQGPPPRNSYREARKSRAAAVVRSEATTT